ncbi:MAG: type II toxin-antitoxin system TacA family antitoxin [Acidimicrobiales bacterium]
MRDESGRKSGRLGLRASEWQRSLLISASQAEGMTVSDFVLRHATLAAEEVLADRRTFMLSAEAWARFSDSLDRPSKDVPGLADLMKSPTVLNEG